MPTPTYNTVTLRRRPIIMRDGAMALRTAARCVDSMLVVMGEVGEFLVVTYGDASRLARAGYQLLR